MDDTALRTTLRRVAELLADAAGPWWIIGSAAVALHGATVAVTRDVDVLVDAADLPMLADRTGVPPRPGIADDRFRSAQVLRLAGQPLALDLFAGLNVRDGKRWRPLRPITREPVSVGNATLFVPSAGELVDILVLFGREKDLARAPLLRAASG